MWKYTTEIRICKNEIAKDKWNTEVLWVRNFLFEVRDNAIAKIHTLNDDGKIMRKIITSQIKMQLYELLINFQQ